MRNKKCLQIIILCVAFCFFCVSCNISKFSYKGEYPQLFTVAINSILGTQGFIESEMQHQPVVELLEIDEQGRMLFCYSEAQLGGAVSLVVCQKANDTYAYYYPDYNFISDEIAEDNYILLYGSKHQADIYNPLNSFSLEDINSLKVKNDWNEEMNETKCIKTEILLKKEKGPLVYEQMKDLCEKIVTNTGNSGNKRDVQFFIADNYGRSIYVLHGKYVEKEEDRFVAVLLFNPDGSYNEETCVMELVDKYNYQDELKAFKEFNNWNEPWEGNG